MRILSPGNYTAVVSGKNETTGIGLVEVYDLAQSASAQLANISSRGFVDTGDMRLSAASSPVEVPPAHQRESSSVRLVHRLAIRE